MITELISYLVIAGGLQAAFFSVVLLVRKRTISNNLLALHLLSFAIFIIMPEVYKRYNQVIPHITASYFPFMLLLGPSIFLHVKSRLTKGFQSKWLDSLHLVPFFVNYIYLAPFLLESSAYKASLNQRVAAEGIPVDFNIWWAIYCVHILVYLGFSLRRLRKFNEPDYKPSSEKIKWLRKLIIYNIIVWGLYFTFFVAYQAGVGKVFFNESTIVLSLVMSLIAYAIGYQAFKNPAQFQSANTKYSTAGLSGDLIKLYHTKLLDIIEQEQPFASATRFLMSSYRKVPPDSPVPLLS